MDRYDTSLGWLLQQEHKDSAHLSAQQRSDILKDGKPPEVYQSKTRRSNRENGKIKYEIPSESQCVQTLASLNIMQLESALVVSSSRIKCLTNIDRTSMSPSP